MSPAQVTTRKRPPAQSLFCPPGNDSPHLVPQPPERERDSFAAHFFDSFALALGESRHEGHLIKKHG